MVKTNLYLALAILLLILSCAPAADLKITSHAITVREYTGELNNIESLAVVTGTAINTGNTEIKNCVIRIIFYDKNKEIIGSAESSKEILKPGDVWNFTVQLKGPNAWKVLSYDILPGCR